MDSLIRTPHLLCNQATSQGQTFTHSPTAKYFYSASWTWKRWFHPPKGWLLWCLLRVDQTPLLPPEAGLNLILGSYQSDEWGFQVGSWAFPGSFLQPELTSSAHQRETPSPGSIRSGGTWQGQSAQCFRDVEPVTRRWKYYPPNPRQAPKNVAGGLWQRLRGHHSFWEASLLSKPAATQQTHVQRLSIKNKGSFSYIPFRASYRNEGVQLVPYIITCYFFSCFKLWGEVTLLWYPGNIPQFQFSFVVLCTH
jgi:hypothetical protein